MPLSDIRDLTIADVKSYLRVEHDLEDMTIKIILESAKSMILSYLNAPNFEYYENYYDAFNNVIGERDLPSEFTMAALLLCSHWYDRRELVTPKYEQGKVLPFGFDHILAPYRNWMTEVEDIVY